MKNIKGTTKDENPEEVPFFLDFWDIFGERSLFSLENVLTLLYGRRIMTLCSKGVLYTFLFWCGFSFDRRIDKYEDGV